jgi:hypothetical protein
MTVGEGFPEATQLIIILEFTRMVKSFGEVVNDGLERGSSTVRRELANGDPNLLLAEHV